MKTSYRPGYKGYLMNLFLLMENENNIFSFLSLMLLIYIENLNTGLGGKKSDLDNRIKRHARQRAGTTAHIIFQVKANAPGTGLPN